MIVRLLIKDHPQQFQESKNIFSRIAQGEQKAIILPSVIMEVIFVMTKIYTTPLSVVITTIEHLLQHEHIVNTDKSDILLACNIMSKENIDFVDALLIAKHQLY